MRIVQHRASQYIISILSVGAVATLSFFASDVIGYRSVALFLMVTVSLLAMFFDILPVLLAAILSALVWDFFFITPKYEFSVSSREDLLLLSMYFIIAMVNGVLTFQIRRAEKQLRKKEEKEKAIKLYNALLNSLSHELRTPIAAIIGAADTLKENDHKLSEENKQDLFTEISTASLRLNHQVENLLNMSRVESGVLTPRRDWCDMNELIYAAIDKLDPRSADYRFTVELEKDLPLFKLDYGLMEQVLVNLLGNAVHYTPPGSHIHVAVSCKIIGTDKIDETYSEKEFHRNKKMNELSMVITDNGQGFPEEEIKYVFDKFYRLKDTAPGGTGLGLSIAKGFVQAHHGRITVRNLPTGGAEFAIRIPAETTDMNRLKHE